MMDIEIITENISELKNEFNIYLKKYLVNSFESKINFIKYGFDSRNINFLVYYDKIKLKSPNFNDHSIYYGSLIKEDFDIYCFGFDQDIKFNKNYIKPRIILSLNTTDTASSGIVFGKDENNIYLLMRIKFDLLGIHQQAVLKSYNDIYEINNENYINLGSFNNNIEIIRNLRNFVSKITIIDSKLNYLNLNFIHIPKDYKKLIGLPGDYQENNNKFDLKKNSYCMLCGHDIDITYEINKNFRKFVGENPDKCASCYSKILISYFKSKIKNTKNTDELILFAKNKDLIKFYLNLYKTWGLIDESSNLLFIKNLDIYDDFFHEIPENLLIKDDFMTKNNRPYKKRKKTIDSYTFKKGRSYNKFKNLLKKYDLTPKEETKIKKILYEELESKKYFNIKVEDRIIELMKEYAHNKEGTNIFKLTNRLNELTLKNNEELNDGFISKLIEYNLNVYDGWEIRKIVMHKIDDCIIVHKNTIELELNKLIEKNGISNKDTNFNKNIQSDEKNDFLKEFYIIKNHCYINILIEEKDLSQFIQIINKIKSKFSVNIISLIITKKLSFYKISIDIKLSDSSELINNFLIENSFKKILVENYG